MRRDHRPYWMHAFGKQYENAWASAFLEPHFESLGENAKIVRPWNVEVFGPNVRAGQAIHVVSRRDQPVSFTVWSPQDAPGEITIGDCCFFAGGVRLLAAEKITIGDGALFAKNTSPSPIATGTTSMTASTRARPAPRWCSARMSGSATAALSARA
jgi:acetyltransferase-like isoleucine patch superfamily enzyme